MHLSKEEIRQEAIKYLRRTEDGDGNALEMASFENWVEFISNKVENFVFKILKLNIKFLKISKNKKGGRKIKK